MDGECQSGKAIEKSGRRGIQKFIANAIDTPISDGASILPLPVSDDFFEGYAIARSAPGGDHDVRIETGDFFVGNLMPGSACEPASRSFDQLRDPGLRGDQRLAPFFAENSGSTCSGPPPTLFADCFDG